jgi:peptide/nickel transport system substrate-binding protein
MRTTPLNRRHLLAGIGALPFIGTGIRPHHAVAQEFLPELIIDLPGEPESIDPALAYSPRDWSVVHSIYDALVQFDQEGNLVPLAAESFSTTDALTFEVTLRAGMTFHDGSPVTTAAIVRSVDYMKAAESSAVDLFATIDRVEIVDDLNANIICTVASPWLPAQLAAWIVLLPEGFSAGIATTAPVGSGPYAFETYETGSQIVLRRNENYTWGSPKGTPLADRVIYRFVPEATTRVADLSTGAAHIITEIPVDQVPALEGSDGESRIEPIVGLGFIRVPNDVKPFDDVRVRQALNHAVDVETIAEALIDESVKRVATVYPDERAMGFDPDLEPYSYDPEKAKQLLTEAGYPDGFETELEITATARLDIAQAIVEQLAEVGITVTITNSEYATFNAGWTDPERPALRMVTWSPLYDPYSFLGLICVTGGYLSRYSNGEVDAAFAESSAEPDAGKRADKLREVGKLLHDDPAAIYLWNLVASYGVASDAAAWASRGDEYVIATSVSA